MNVGDVLSQPKIMISVGNIYQVEIEIKEENGSEQLTLHQPKKVETREQRWRQVDVLLYGLSSVVLAERGVCRGQD